MPILALIELLASVGDLYDTVQTIVDDHHYKGKLPDVEITPEHIEQIHAAIKIVNDKMSTQEMVQKFMGA